MFQKPTVKQTLNILKELVAFIALQASTQSLPVLTEKPP